MKRIKQKWLRITIKTLLCIFVLVPFTLNLFYINTTIYQFPEKKKFSGAYIFNPYKNLPKASYRANFHAHSAAWKNVTDGHNSEKEVFDAYTKNGYDISGISNYHSISTYGKSRTDLYIPMYEHGYNIKKSHCLGINVEEVSYFDYPLWQGTSQEQKIIQNIRAKKGIVTIAHPKFGGGRSLEDMELLTNYHFVEVLNHYRNSEEYWDAALSAGRLAWIMGDDDTHDLEKEATFQIWNIIHSDFRTKDSILAAMKSGKNYAVQSKNRLCDNSLIGLELISPTQFVVQLENQADTIKFIGQGGKILKTVLNADKANYSFSAKDTYVRVVACNKNSSLFLNPLLRYDGSTVPLAANDLPEIKWFMTWLLRLLFIAVGFSLLILIRKIIKA